MKLAVITIGIVLGSWLSWAQADIYKFVDENNVVHFHNIANHGDTRYKLYKREAKRKGVLSKTPIKAKANLLSKANLLDRQRFSPIITNMAQVYKIDEALLHAVISAESGYNPNAVSPKGAVGLMQLMPATARRYGVTDSTDPAANIHGGTRYLRDLLNMFGNDLPLAVAAYNCGENAVIKYGNTIPPYRETVNYVAKVLAMYQKSKAK